MDLEALRQKALLSLRQRQQQKKQEDSSDSITSQPETFLGKEDGELSDSPDFKQAGSNYNNKRILPPRSFSLKRVKQSSSAFHNTHQRLHSKQNKYFFTWNYYSRQDLLAKQDSLLQLVHESEEMERSLRQRLLECRQTHRTAQRQLESLQQYLNSPYTIHMVAKPAERADRLLSHMIMRDSATLWFPERFKGHPAYVSFVSHQDTATFNHVQFDPQIPFCLEEACFGQCECLQQDSEEAFTDVATLSFNHFNLICKKDSCK